MSTRSKVALGVAVFALLLTALLLPARRQLTEASVPATATHALRGAPLIVPRPARNAGIAGRVTGAQGPLQAKARVCATCANCEITLATDQRCVDTDDAGTYELTGLGASGYRVTASAGGYAIAAANGGRPLFLPAGTRRDDVDIVLAVAGADVSGQVLDATGGPIPAASVRLVTWDAPPVVITATADDDGRFTASVAPGRVTAIASAEGYASATVYRVVPTDDLSIALTPAGTVTGTVSTLQGERPVADARVFALAEDIAAAGAREAISEDDGSFRIDGLDPGRYTLRATAAGYTGTGDGAFDIELGATVSEMRVLLQRATQVSGRVLIAAGGSEQPCEQGLLMLGTPHPAIGLRAGSKWTAEKIAAQPPAPVSLSAPIGADGRVHFDAVPRGHYFASVACDGHLQHDGPDTVVVGADDIDGLVWRAVPATRLSIRVVDEQNRPAPGVQVWLRWPDSEGQGGAVTQLESNAEGLTEPLSHLYPGVYSARAANGFESESVAIELRAGVPEVQATLRLKGSAALLVDARDDRDRPVDELAVSARACAPDGAAASGQPADAELGIAAARAQMPMPLIETIGATPLGRGRYRIGPVIAGCYRIEVADMINPAVAVRGADLANEIRVATSATVTLRVTVPRKGVLEGSVVASDGSAGGDVWVSAFASEKPVDPRELAIQRSLVHAQARVLTDPEGHFRIPGLDPQAVYDVQAEQPGGASVVQRRVAVAQTVTLTIPATGSIEGTVTNASGRAIDDFTLSVTEAQTQRGERRTFVGASGRFALRGLTPGQLEIHAFERSGEAAQLKVDLKAGERLADLHLTMSTR